jgi:hypothetical protein
MLYIMIDGNNFYFNVSQSLQILLTANAYVVEKQFIA